MVSMILPGKSGVVSIGSFCVEQGRWSRRGVEDVRQFASAAEGLPSREAKLAMKAPPKPAVAYPDASATTSTVRRTSPIVRDETSTRQAEMWAAVAGVQNKLSERLGAPVGAAQSTWLWSILAGASLGLLASTLARLYSSAFFALQVLPVSYLLHTGPLRVCKLPL